MDAATLNLRWTCLWIIACCLPIHTTFVCLAYSSDMSLDDFPPGHFTYGPNDSDEPAIPEQKPQDNGAKNKAPAKKSTVKPRQGANTAEALKSFPKITKKQPQSDDAAAGNKDPYKARPSRKCWATEKGTAVVQTVEDQKARQKQQEMRLSCW